MRSSLVEKQTVPEAISALHDWTDKVAELADEQASASLTLALGNGLEMLYAIERAGVPPSAVKQYHRIALRFVEIGAAVVGDKSRPSWERGRDRLLALMAAE